MLGQVTPARRAAPPHRRRAAAAPAAEAAPAPAAEAPRRRSRTAPPKPHRPRPPKHRPQRRRTGRDTGGLPRIDPNNLPDGIDAVAKGRLKKLAIFQERGQAPPADLVEKLKPILDQMA